MRTIKFRIWDGKCYRGNLNKYFLDLQSGEIKERAFSDIYDEWYYVDSDCDFVIEQYTGLEDMVGKDVYEGDIVQFDNMDREVGNKSEVKWVSENYGSNYSGWMIFKTSMQIGPFKVIGNIHENPELLES